MNEEQNNMFSNLENTDGLKPLEQIGQNEGWLSNVPNDVELPPLKPIGPVEDNDSPEKTDGRTK